MRSVSDRSLASPIGASLRNSCKPRELGAGKIFDIRARGRSMHQLTDLAMAESVLYVNRTAGFLQLDIPVEHAFALKLSNFSLGKMDSLSG